MDFVTIWWTKFTDLSWWAMSLWVIYTFYFLVRAYAFWDATDDEKLWKGYRKVMFGAYEKYFRVYHIFRILIDLPPAIIGLFFPLLRWALAFKIYEFKDVKK